MIASASNLTDVATLQADLAFLIPAAPWPENRAARAAAPVTHCSEETHGFTMCRMELAAQPAILYLDPSLLNHELGSTERVDHSLPWNKQYEIWRHGNELLAGAKSQRDLEVAIMQFQRAVEQRDTILEQLYRFRTIPWFPSNTSQYSIMASLGMIRPSLKEPLRQLRNRIAHEVADVELDHKQCDYLCDAAWYYLKATDLPARQCATTLVLTCGEDDPHWTMLEFGFSPGSWSISIQGDVPDRHVLTERSPQALAIAMSASTVEEYRGVRKVRFRGSVTGPDLLCRRLVQTFFDEAI